jgi:GTP-binding protein
MKSTPVVAIVGRANVGKSSIFNRVVGRQRAIVANKPGTTRDRVIELIQTEKQSFWLVDTAGFKQAEDDFEASIQEQIKEATVSADCIWVVVDSTSNFSNEDRLVAKMALKSQKPIFLVINKSDKSSKKSGEKWEKSGIKNRIETSAMHGTGLEELVDSTLSIIPRVRTKAEEGLRVALIGRPNVGKSSLFNALAQKQEAIVADLAGTTRDVNQVVVRYHGQPVEIFDTAGIRRSGKIGRDVEHFSVLRTLKAVDRADICCLLMEADELNTHLDQKIAGIVKQAGKSLIIVVSKWDAIEKDPFTRDSLAPKIAYAFQHVWWAPLIFISSQTGQNVTKLFELFNELQATAKTDVPTNDINKLLQVAVHEHPPAGLRNKHPKLRYITQTDTAPPTFLVQGRDLKYLHWSYKRYLEKKIREKWDFSGTPIVIEYRPDLFEKNPRKLK